MSVVLDTSALAAVVLGEPDADAYLAVMQAHRGDLHVSAATAVEAGIVIEAKQGGEATEDLRRLVQLLGIALAPFDSEQARVAVAAWRRFGKGRHPAGLNLGDCFSYALAKAIAEPLLFKGDDFSQTDIKRAI